MNDRDRTKLPKWAQSELSRLESNIDYWKQQAGVSNVTSNTCISRLAGTTPLPDNAKIRFFLLDGYEIDVWTDGENVYVNGDSTMQVIPSASNSIRLRKGNY